MYFLMFSYYFVGILNNSFPFQGMSDLAGPAKDPGPEDFSVPATASEPAVSSPQPEADDSSSVSVAEDSTVLPMSQPVDGGAPPPQLPQPASSAVSVSCQTDDISCLSCGGTPFTMKVVETYFSHNNAQFHKN
jgi:hypothetical protein